MNSVNEYLYHHGILGQKWGRKNGPPYPLNPVNRSPLQKKLNGDKYTKSGLEVWQGYKSSVKNYNNARVGVTAKSMAGSQDLGWMKQFRTDMDDELSKNKDFQLSSIDDFKKYLSDSGMDISKLSDDKLKSMYEQAQKALDSYKLLLTKDKESGTKKSGGSGSGKGGSGKGGSSKGSSSEESGESEEVDWEDAIEKSVTGIIKSNIEGKDGVETLDSLNKHFENVESFSKYLTSLNVDVSNYKTSQLKSMLNKAKTILKEAKHEAYSKIWKEGFEKDLSGRLLKLNPDFTMKDVNDFQVYLDELGYDTFDFSSGEIKKMYKEATEILEKLKAEKQLKHHGILGQKWGRRNGPPYPLNPLNRSSAEKRLNGNKYTKSGLEANPNSKIGLGGGGGGSSDEEDEEWLKKMAADMDNLLKAEAGKNGFSDIQDFKSYLEEIGVKTTGLSNKELENMRTKANLYIKSANVLKSGKDKADKVHDFVEDTKSKADKLVKKGKEKVKTFTGNQDEKMTKADFEKGARAVNEKIRLQQIQKEKKEAEKQAAKQKAQPHIDTERKRQQVVKEASKQKENQSTINSAAGTRRKRPHGRGYYSTDVDVAYIETLIDMLPDSEINSAKHLQLEKLLDKTKEAKGIKHSELFELYHHGILGQKWGRRNGPPYPLYRSMSKSAKAQYKSYKYKEKAERYAKKEAEREAKQNSRIERRAERIERLNNSIPGKIYWYGANPKNWPKKTKTYEDVKKEYQTKNQNKTIDKTKSISEMSDQELASSINRMRLERQYIDLISGDSKTANNSVPVKTGQNYVNDIVNNVGKIAKTGVSVMALVNSIYGVREKQRSDALGKINNTIEIAKANDSLSDLSKTLASKKVDSDLDKLGNEVVNDFFKDYVTDKSNIALAKTGREIFNELDMDRASSMSIGDPVTNDLSRVGNEITDELFKK